MAIRKEFQHSRLVLFPRLSFRSVSKSPESFFPVVLHPVSAFQPSAFSMLARLAQFHS